MSLLRYFTDPVLQAPTIASMLMCLASALIGVIVFLRKRSLLGEALSHACYPGVVIAVFFTAHFFPAAYDSLAFIVLCGAFCTCALGLWLIEKMQKSLKVANDAALCFVLSIFFGVGVLIASRLQFSYSLWYKSVFIFLFGQAATMTDIHILIYAILALLILLVFFFLYHSLQIFIFDKDYGKTVGVPLKLIEGILFFLLILAIIVGIRSVGVVLMAGMLITPAIAARQLSDRLSLVFLLSAIIGALSGFFGNYLSTELGEWGKSKGFNFTLPTGPMILLSATCICVLAFFLAPKRGFISRRMRAGYFRRECQRENLLKYLWKKGQRQWACYRELKDVLEISHQRLFWMLFCLKREGWIEKKAGRCSLSHDGWQRAARIVRLHRLWEVYLVHLGQGVEKVHRSAEEMEHILTPELEQELTTLLDDPKLDPHKQPIPAREERL